MKPEREGPETLREFLQRFGIDADYMYSPDVHGIDPDSDWAVFPLVDRLRCWEMMRCVREHTELIRSTVRWDADGSVVVPLTDTEVSLACGAIRTFWEKLAGPARRYGAVPRSRGEHAGLIAKAVDERTVGRFQWVWEETGPSYDEAWAKIGSLDGLTLQEQAERLSQLEPDPDSDVNRSLWPLQWTYEFGLAITEFVGALQDNARMLAEVCGTELLDSGNRQRFADMRVAEHLALYGLEDNGITYRHPLLLKLGRQDVYCAAYLAWGLERIMLASDNGAPHSYTESALRYILSVTELLYVVAEAMMEEYAGMSRMSNIVTGFIVDVMIPALTNRGHADHLHPSSFDRTVRNQTARLHALARDLAGDMTLALPGLGHYLGSDGTMLAERRLLAAGMDIETGGLGLEGSEERLSPCSLCERLVPDPRKLSEIMGPNRFCCPDMRGCLAVQLGTRNYVPCNRCGDSINLRFDSFRIERLRIVCDDDGCDERTELRLRL